MSAKVTLQDVASVIENQYPRDSVFSDFEPYDLSHEMIGLCETPASRLPSVAKEQPISVPSRFLKVMAWVLALIAFLSLVAILAIDMIGMNGGPVLISFDRYLSLLEVGAGTGTAAGIFRFFAGHFSIT